jgi:BirA family biotin operon repressor/biotin-[acetyl-CoA-carboxylase] ligase
MSLSRRFRAPVASMSGLSLVAGIAVAEAIALDGVGLKWPNDLMVDGRKLGGILVNLRAASASGGVGAPTCDAVIGIGLNLRLPPDTAIDQPWTDLARCGAEPFTRNALVGALLEVILPALERFEHEGMSAFVARWQRLDALAGREVRVHEGERVHEGLLVGITASGALRLRSGGEESVFNSGEVSLRSA